METFLIILACIVVILFWYFVAKEFQRIAELKGHYETRFFWCTFLFSVLGILMVIALPDRGEKNESVQPVENDELPEL